MSEVSVRYMIDDVPAAVQFYTTLLGFTLEQMREVLDTLDGLAVPELGAARRRALERALVEHQQAVLVAVDELQARADAGRAFARSLAQHLSR